MLNSNAVWGLVDQRSVELTDHDVCAAVLRDPAIKSAPVGHEDGRSQVNVLTLDGPAHDRIRQVLVEVLAAGHFDGPTPQQSARFLQGIQAGQARGCISELVGTTLCRYFEYPHQTHEPIVTALTGTLGILNPGTPGSERALFRLLAELDRHSQSEKSIPRRMLGQAVSDGRLTPAEAVINEAVLLHGGFENPVNGIALLIQAFTREPRRLRMLDAGPSAARTVFGPVLDASPPVRRLIRWAARDRPEWGIKAADAIVVSLEHPGSQPPSLTFGLGKHRCPGRNLMWQVAAEVLRLLCDLSDQELADVHVNLAENRATLEVL